jgi:prolyl-tRNA synthetase
MRLSKNFTKTAKETSNEESSKNAQLLIRAGYIHKTMAGVYSYLPLGLRVLNKIEDIVRKNLNEIGGQEVLLSALSPKENWERTERWKEISEYFCLPSQSGTEYRLNPTHEEVISPIIAQYISSYKDLPDYKPSEGRFPLAVYQIQTKFRDELRAKAGLMRGREFRMKDMYDVHQTKESQEAYFELITQTYHRIYEQMGLKSYSVNASGGVFSEKMSREFQVLCEAGEDWVYLDTKLNQAYNQEVAPCQAPEYDYTQEEEQAREDVLLEGVIGVEALYKKLGIAITKTTKTLFYEDQEGKLVVAAVRGDRSVSEEKLQKLYGKSLKLATAETVKKYTGAEIGYAGLINLPTNCTIYLDNSIAKLKNFETGTNKTGYHSVNVCFNRDVAIPNKFYDIKEAQEGDINPESGQVYEVHKGAEVGNIFDLGQKWIKAFDISYMDENNQKQYPYMGCHGIGTSRCMGVLAEIYSDEKGLKWPENVAPFKYHLITNFKESDSQEVKNQILSLATQIYQGKHQDFDGEVLWDDRSGISIGEKFKDAELIGCPIQLIITPRSLEKEPNGVEIKNRS